MKTGLIITLAVSAAALIGLSLWLWTPDLPRAALEARYLASPDDMREVAGTRLHVRDTGPKDAPAIVMLHGFGSSLHTWEPWAKALGADHRVVRFDMPGAGLSPPDSTGDYSDARAVVLLAALMDQLGIPRAALIGNSIGGRLAWTFAALKPERVSKLVLISPDGFASPGFDYGGSPEVPAAAALLKYVLPKPLMRMNLTPAYGDPSRLSQATVDRYYDLLRAPGARGAIIDRMRQTVLVDPATLLPRIQAPVLLLWGEKDGMIPFANSADYRKLLPDSTLVPLPGLGHVPMEEAPAESLPPVRAFLDR